MTEEREQRRRDGRAGQGRAGQGREAQKVKIDFLTSPGFLDIP